jgi:hypothetical protein
LYVGSTGHGVGMNHPAYTVHPHQLPITSPSPPHSVYYAATAAAASHHHLPVSPVYAYPPAPGAALGHVPYELSLSTVTPATSLADSSSSLTLTSILRELESIRRENEALKVTLQRQQQPQ